MVHFETQKCVGITHCSVKEFGGAWYMHITYRIKNENGDVIELDIPRVRIPDKQTPTIIRRSGPFLFYNDEFHADFWWDDVVLETVDGYAFKTEILERHAEKLTVAEIEKRLGYKVEIISEEDDVK